MGMTSGQTRRTAGKRKRGGKAAPARQTLAAHRAYAPLLGVWGAVLGGAVIAVMPFPLIGAMLEGTLLGSWGATSQILFAAILATLAGSTLFAIAMLQHRKAVSGTKPSMVELAMRQVTPINPAVDLGSRRLDDPVDTMPFSTPAWRDADLNTPHPVRRREHAPVAVAEVAEEQTPPAPAAPAALDLAAFDELLLDQTTEPEPAIQSKPMSAPSVPHLRAVETDPMPLPGTAALARLRATPPEALSLAEMVERFAAALHDHRESPPTDLPAAADLAAREAALAEALRALAALSGGTGTARSAVSATGSLRAALSQAHLRRGVG